MTALTRLDTITAYIKHALFLIGVLTATASAIGTLGSIVVLRLFWPMLLNELKTELDIATKADLSRIEYDLKELSGENRVYKTLPGTYILEPVLEGNPIEMILVMRRTQRGIPCVFMGGVPLFMDGRGISFPGEPIKPIKQLGLSAERLPLTLHAPESIEPGRVSVVISMQYSCPFGQDNDMIDIFEETEAFYFQMTPRVVSAK